jgi:hypothetical protein
MQNEIGLLILQLTSLILPSPVPPCALIAIEITPLVTMASRV